MIIPTSQYCDISSYGNKKIHYLIDYRVSEGTMGTNVLIADDNNDIFIYFGCYFWISIKSFWLRHGDGISCHVGDRGTFVALEDP